MNESKIEEQSRGEVHKKPKTPPKKFCVEPSDVTSAPKTMEKNDYEDFEKYKSKHFLITDRRRTHDSIKKLNQSLLDYEAKCLKRLQKHGNPFRKIYSAENIENFNKHLHSFINGSISDVLALLLNKETDEEFAVYLCYVMGLIHPGDTCPYCKKASIILFSTKQSYDAYSSQQKKIEKTVKTQETNSKDTIKKRCALGLSYKCRNENCNAVFSIVAGSLFQWNKSEESRLDGIFGIIRNDEKDQELDDEKENKGKKMNRKRKWDDGRGSVKNTSKKPNIYRRRGRNRVHLFQWIGVLI